MSERSKPGTFVLVAALVAILSAANVPALGDENSLKELVLAEYPKAVEVLQAHFATVSGSGRETYHQNIGQPSERKWTHTVEFARSGDQAKCVADWGPAETARDESSQGGPDQKQVSKSAPGRQSAPRRRPAGEIIRCYNQENALELHKTDVKGAYELKYFEKRIDSVKEKKVDPIKIVVDRDLGFLNCTYDSNLHHDMFSNPNFSIDHVFQEKSEANKLLLKVEYSIKVNPQAKSALRPDKVAAVLGSGSFTVSPDEKWVLYGYELWIRFPNGTYRLGTRRIEYDGQADGIPTPKRVITQAFGMPKGKDPGTDGRPAERIPIEEKTFEFAKLQFGPVPNRDFTLSAYRLPEIDKPSRRDHTSRASYWFIGVAIITLTLGLLLRYYVTRPKPAASSD